MLLKRLIVSSVAVAALGSGAVVAATSAAADPTISGTYNTVSPVRIVDSRSGLGVPKAKVGAGKTVSFNVATPLGATSPSAVSLSVTAVSPTRGGYLLAYSGVRPATSTVDYQAGHTVSNSTVVAVGTSGVVNVFNGGVAPLDLVVDGSGYWTGGTGDPTSDGALHTVPAVRVVDSRKTGGALVSRKDHVVPVAGKFGVPTGASAVVVNIAAADPQKAGFLTASAQPESDTGDPTTGNNRTAVVTFAAGSFRADLITVPIDQNGAIDLYNGSAAPVNFIVDIAGYFTGGSPAADGAFLASDPYRADDTRTGSAVATNGVHRVPVFADSSQTAQFKAVVVTVTVINATASGYVVAFGGSDRLPPTAGLTHLAGEVVSQTMIVPLNDDGTISLANQSNGLVDFVTDVDGFVLNNLGSSNGAQTAHRARAAISQSRHLAVRRMSR